MLYDITLPISNELPTFPGDPSIAIDRVLSIDRGDPCTVSQVTLGVHTGTHIDAPVHQYAKGKTVDTIAIELLIGNCQVVEIDVAETIEVDHLREKDLGSYERVLFKTRNSREWQRTPLTFNSSYVALGLSAARYLIENKCKLVGIDYLSVEAFHSKDNVVHKELFSHDVVILEGIDLSDVPVGEYELLCFPLKLMHCDAAPARVFLRSVE